MRCGSIRHELHELETRITRIERPDQASSASNSTRENLCVPVGMFDICELIYPTIISHRLQQRSYPLSTNHYNSYSLRVIRVIKWVVRVFRAYSCNSCLLHDV